MKALDVPIQFTELSSLGQWKGFSITEGAEQKCKDNRTESYRVEKRNNNNIREVGPVVIGTFWPPSLDCKLTVCDHGYGIWIFALIDRGMIPTNIHCDSSKDLFSLRAVGDLNETGQIGYIVFPQHHEVGCAKQQVPIIYGVSIVVLRLASGNQQISN